jgi:hypothetical protein
MNIFSAKLTTTQKNVIKTAETRLNEYYGKVLSHWGEATVEQKKAFIEGSPLLKWLIEWVAQWKVE